MPTFEQPERIEVKGPEEETKFEVPIKESPIKDLSPEVVAQGRATKEDIEKVRASLATGETKPVSEDSTGLKRAEPEKAGMGQLPPKPGKWGQRLRRVAALVGLLGALSGGEKTEAGEYSGDSMPQGAVTNVEGGKVAPRPDNMVVPPGGDNVPAKRAVEQGVPKQQKPSQPAVRAGASFSGGSSYAGGSMYSGGIGGGVGFGTRGSYGRAGGVEYHTYGRQGPGSVEYERVLINKPRGSVDEKLTQAGRQEAVKRAFGIGKKR